MITAANAIAPTTAAGAPKCSRRGGEASPEWPGRQRHELAFCAIFREEAPFLDEWISFHLGVGGSHFFLNNNLDRSMPNATRRSCRSPVPSAVMPQSIRTPGLRLQPLLRRSDLGDRHLGAHLLALEHHVGRDEQHDRAGDQRRRSAATRSAGFPAAAAPRRPPRREAGGAGRGAVQATASSATGSSAPPPRTADRARSATARPARPRSADP